MGPHLVLFRDFYTQELCLVVLKELYGILEIETRVSTLEANTLSAVP